MAAKRKLRKDGGDDDGGTANTSVKVAIKTAIKPDFIGPIQECTQNLARIAFDAYNLLSMFVWLAIDREQAQDLDLSPPACKRIVIASTKKELSKVAGCDLLKAAWGMWHEARTSEGYTVFPSPVRLSQGFHYMAGEMATAICNHLAQHSYKSVLRACKMWVERNVHLSPAQAKVIHAHTCSACPNMHTHFITSVCAYIHDQLNCCRTPLRAATCVHGY